MIIVSQDREKIVNIYKTFNLQIQEVHLGYGIRAFGESDSLFSKVDLGKYATKERAKEVLEDIADSYEFLKLAKAGICQLDITDQNFKYEMPLE